MRMQLTNILVWIPSVSAIIALIALIYNYKRNPRKNRNYSRGGEVEEWQNRDAE